MGLIGAQSQCRGDKVEHRWRMVAHIDGCHFFASTFVCVDCSATLHVSHERDNSTDPYAIVWYDDGDNGYGDGDPCPRCRELMHGAEAREPEIVFEVVG